MTFNQLNDKPISIKGYEWRWMAVWVVFMVALVSLPYLYGATLSTPDNHFGGFIIGVEDGNSYLAKMQEGKAGHWLFYLAYTPEPHKSALFFVYYILLGKLAGVLGINLLLLFHLSRIITIPFALFSFYSFTAYFTPVIWVRRISFLLFGLTAGLGWLWLLLGFPATLGEMPVDLWVPDASFFLSAYTFPHLPLAQGLLLWVAIATLSFLDGGNWKWWMAASGAGLLVSFIHPYTLPVLGIPLGIYLLWQNYQKRWPFRTSIGRLMLVILPSAPYLIYVWLIFETNFAFNAWRLQSLTLSPAPIHYILGFGLTLPLVGVGIWQRYFALKRHTPFLIIWIATVPFLLYLPIALQRRFLDGYQAPLALLGATGLVWLVKFIKSGPQRRLVMTVIIGTMALTNLFLLMGGLFIVKGKASQIFHSGHQQLAFTWLADHAMGRVVFTAYDTGNVLPAYVPVRVFVGHGPETVRSEEKQQQVVQFFSSSTNDAWRRALLTQYNIEYLYYGPHERDLGPFLPDDAPYLKQVYKNDAVQLYQVIQTDAQ